MKRITSILLTLFIVMGVISCSFITVSAESSNGFIFEPDASGDGYTIVGYEGEVPSTLVIPSKYNELPVTQIESDVFQDCDTIKAVTIPDSIICILDYAFAGCDNLSLIILPDTDVELYAGVFEDTAYYNNPANWSNGILYIGDYLVFAEPSVSGVVKIKQGTKRIATCAFSDCEGITSVTIPDSIVYIGDGAFSGCSGLESIAIPDKSINIGCSILDGTAFKNIAENWVDDVLYAGNHVIDAESYISGDVTLRDGTINIAESTFWACTLLNSINIPKSVLYISDTVFTFCSGLKAINVASENPAYLSEDGILFNKDKTELIRFPSNKLSEEYIVPQTVTSVRGYAFEGCSKLITITLPESLTEIAYSTFYECFSLENVNIPQSVTKIGSDAFAYCSSIKNITIPDGVLSIGARAFNNCDLLENIEIPEKVILIGDEAFCFNEALTGIDVNSKNNYYSSADGVLFDKDKEILICYPNGKNDTEYNIPSSVKVISNQAFICSEYLTKINFPDGLKTIGEMAFWNSPRLSNINITGSVEEIGCRAFGDCNAISSVVIGEGVKSIGEWAFDNCTSLTTLYLPESIEYIGAYAFAYCAALKNVYYSGSADSKNEIYIDEGDYYLNKATWHYAKASKPATPKVTTSNEIGGVQISWNKVAGATKYNVYRRQGGYSTWTLVGTTTGNSLLDKNVKSGVYYCYSVRAYNSAGQYSDFVTANTQTRKYMATPKLTTIYNHVSGLAIKWNAVAGVTNGYRVYRRGAGSTYWTYLGTTKNLYFIDSGVKNASGEYFRYTVIADGGYHSKFDTTGLYLKRLANPTLTSAVSSSAGITVKWGAVKGTTGYYVYRKTANSTWTRVGTVGGTNNTTFLDKTAKKGTTYTYTVRAVYGSTTSAYNAGISCYDKY